MAKKANEIECYALKIEPSKIRDFDKDMAHLLEQTKDDPHLVGMYIDPHDYSNYLLFDDAKARGEAYTRINKGAKREEDIIVSLIPEVCYVDKKYLPKEN